MLNDLFDDAMFFEAMQVHAVCLDAEIDDDTIRVLTYMHFKIKSNGNNADYFSDAPETDAVSIEIMLGNSAPIKSMLPRSGKKPQVIEAVMMDLSDGLAEKIRNLDATFRNNLGMENRLRSELKNRLRLYRDTAFREDMVALYRETVAPRIGLYEKPTIQRAFRQARERESVMERD